MRTGKFYIPTDSPEDWRKFLADPDVHWKSGHSAKALAHCWEDADGFPKEVRRTFATASESEIRDLKMLIGLPEFKVALPGGARASQNDIWVLARGLSHLVSIAVEGKATDNEGFDKPVSDRLHDAGDGMVTRIRYLAETLGLPEASLKPIKYQLVHRTVSAVKMAQSLNAPYAMLLVHSFHQQDAHFEDYLQFLNTFGLTGNVNEVVGPHHIGPIKVYFAWVRGDEHYLTV